MVQNHGFINEIFTTNNTVFIRVWPPQICSWWFSYATSLRGQMTEVRRFIWQRRRQQQQNERWLAPSIVRRRQ